MQLKVDLKRQAMRALPPSQLEYAKGPLSVEECDFPLDFRHPTYTPPITGYSPDQYAEDDTR